MQHEMTRSEVGGVLKCDQGRNDGNSGRVEVMNLGCEGVEVEGDECRGRMVGEYSQW